MAEASALIFSYRIQLGLRVDSLQDYVAAFFRSSAAGPWWPDEEPERRPHLLQFSRGNWHSSDRTGQRTPLPILSDPAGHPLPATRPAQLAVVVQHLHDGNTVIAIRYRYLFPVQEVAVQQNREREHAFWQQKTQAEVDELTSYLEQSL